MQMIENKQSITLDVVRKPFKILALLFFRITQGISKRLIAHDVAIPDNATVIGKLTPAFAAFYSLVQVEEGVVEDFEELMEKKLFAKIKFLVRICEKARKSVDENWDIIYSALWGHYLHDVRNTSNITLVDVAQKGIVFAIRSTRPNRRLILRSKRFYKLHRSN